MGNLITGEYSYTSFKGLINQGLQILQKDASFGTYQQRQCLWHFLKVIETGPSTNVPWENQVLKLADLFDRVKLAIPKTIKTAKIYAYTQGPKFSSISGGIAGFEPQQYKFHNLAPETQIYLAHVYALVIFMWATYQKESPLSYFYKSDVLHYAFQNKDINDPEQVIAYSQIECFIKAVENLPEASISLNYNLNELGEIIEQMDQEKCVNCLQKGVAGRHFLHESVTSSSESSSSYSSSSSSASDFSEMPTDYGHIGTKNIRSVPSSHIKCKGVTTTIEYLEQILSRLDLLCKYHNLI